jgi:hypothetical protein
MGNYYTRVKISDRPIPLLFRLLIYTVKQVLVQVVNQKSSLPPPPTLTYYVQRLNRRKCSSCWLTSARILTFPTKPIKLREEHGNTGVVSTFTTQHKIWNTILTLNHSRASYMMYKWCIWRGSLGSEIGESTSFFNIHYNHGANYFVSYDLCPACFVTHCWLLGKGPCCSQ